MNNMRAALGISAAATVGILSVAGVLHAQATPGGSPTAKPSSAVAQSPQDVLKDLTPEAIATVGKMGTTLSILTPLADMGSDRAAADEAVKVARAALRVAAVSPVDGVSLCTTTVHGYGTDAYPEPSNHAERAQIDLLVADRPMWVIKFDKVTMPIFGPARREMRDSELQSETVSLIVLVDPSSMTFVRAESI